MDWLMSSNDDVPRHRVRAARTSHDLSLIGSLTDEQVGGTGWGMQEHRLSMVSLLVVVEVVVATVLLVVVDVGACVLAVRQACM